MAFSEVSIPLEKTLGPRHNRQKAPGGGNPSQTILSYQSTEPEEISAAGKGHAYTKSRSYKQEKLLPVGAHLRVRPSTRADTWVRPYKKYYQLLSQLGTKGGIKAQVEKLN